jgi:hypothetical protein
MFLIGNIFSMVVGILALIFYNDLTVKEYFSQINTASTTISVPTTRPSMPVEQFEALPVPMEVITPEPVEDPAKPKRIRKIAGK